MASARNSCIFDMCTWVEKTELWERVTTCARTAATFEKPFAAEGVMARRSVSGRGKGKQLHLCRLCGGKDHRQETCQSFAGKKIRELQAELKQFKAGQRKGLVAKSRKRVAY